MPKTSSRFNQDLGFPDGMVFFGPQDAIVSGATPTYVRTGPGLFGLEIAAGETVYLDVNMTNGVLRRSGFFSDTQNIFGSNFGAGLGSNIVLNPGMFDAGDGIPADAAPQGRPGSESLGDGYILPGKPQPPSSMASGQQFTPRTALRLKGFKPRSINVIYSITGAAMTTFTCTVVETQFQPFLAPVQTTLLPSGTNGLVNFINSPVGSVYVPPIAMPNAVYYQITPTTQLTFEMNIVSGSGSLQFFGLELLCEFNFN